jgi:hypothetical protein
VEKAHTTQIQIRTVFLPHTQKTPRTYVLSISVAMAYEKQVIACSTCRWTATSQTKLVALTAHARALPRNCGGNSNGGGSRTKDSLASAGHCSCLFLSRFCPPNWVDGNAYRRTIGSCFFLLGWIDVFSCTACSIDVCLTRASPRVVLDRSRGWSRRMIHASETEMINC